MKPFYLNHYIFLFLLLAGQAFVQASDGGQVIGRNIFGLATDYQSDPVLIDDQPLIYPASSFDALIAIEGATFKVSGFDHSIGGVYITLLDSKTNRTSDTVPLVLDSVDGISHPSAGIKTLWNSVLFTESQTINAAHPDKFINSFKAYYKGKASLVKPYNYGWVSEVIILDAKGQAKVIKNYAMGRLFANQVIIMPDGRTLYLLDSLGNLYLFVAEQANSLAKGDLYAVRRGQQGVEHLQLGSTSALKVKFKLKDMRFDSLFKSEEPKNQRCDKPYKYINTIFGEECLKLNSANKKYAAFFEPVRVLALQEVPGFVPGNSRMTFYAESRKLGFKQADQPEILLTVGEDVQLNSQFIIKEPQ